MVACRKCGASFDMDDAKWCPKCGTPDPLSDEAAAQRSGSSVSSNTSSTKWMWWVGVPVAVIAFMMAMAGMDREKYPGKAQDRAVYETCMNDLKADDRARRGNGAFIAGTCEKIRNDYIQKYGSTP